MRIFRAFRGLTLEALAEPVGVGKAYLSQIENGRRNGTVRVLAACANALDLDDLVWKTCKRRSRRHPAGSSNRSNGIKLRRRWLSRLLR